MTNEQVDRVVLREEQLTEDGGIVKRVYREGTGDLMPCKGDKVSVHYVGTLAADGSKFDSSRDRGSYFEFDLGVGRVIKGWDVGVATMRQGELCDLIVKSEYGYGSSGSGAKIPPDAELIFEVELFSWVDKSTTDIHGDGGVMKKEISSGTGFKKPAMGSKVTAYIVGRVVGSDSTFTDGPVEYESSMGQSIVPVGLEDAINTMQLQAKAKVTLQPKYAFGSAGNVALGVPGNADVEYDITLTAFENMKETWEVNDEEAVKYAVDLKARGTSLFKAGNWKLAEKWYEKALTAAKKGIPKDKEDAEIDSDVEDSEDAPTGGVRAENNVSDIALVESSKELVKACHLNLAMVHLKTKEWSKAASNCDDVLAMADDNVKALFRRAIAHRHRCNYGAALADLIHANKLDPKDKAIRNEYVEVRAQVQQEKAKEKATFAGMFDKVSFVSDAEIAAAAVVAKPLDESEDDYNEDDNSELSPDTDVPMEDVSVPVA